jgi:hypothetical protein
MTASQAVRGKSLAERLIARASAPGGASPEQIRSTHKTEHRLLAVEELARLVAAGRVLEFHRPALGGLGRASRRYFTDPVAGRQWVAEAADAPRRVANATKLRDLREQTEGRAWRNLKPAVQAEPRKVHVPATVKRTVAHTAQFDPRFQCDPRERIVGGFASLGPGRYLDGVA